MKRKILFILFLLICSGILLFVSNSREGISLAFDNFTFETSPYIACAILLILWTILYIVFSIFNGIKQFFVSIWRFFSGRNKETAQKSLFNAFVFALAKRPYTAQKYLKKAEKYYKNHPHLAFLRLITDVECGKERPASEALSNLAKDLELKEVSAFAQAFYERKKDTGHYLELLEMSGSFKENHGILEDLITVNVIQGDYDKAEKIVKSAHSLLGDTLYHFHISLILVLKARKALSEKLPDNALSLIVEAIKLNPESSFALMTGVSCYRQLMRENKALRLLADRFKVKPDFLAVKLFLQMKSDETPEALGKRIAALPRDHEEAEAFLALQAYHFARTHDITSLLGTLRIAEHYHKTLWVEAAQLCIATDKDSSLYKEAVSLLYKALDVAALEVLRLELDLPLASPYKTILSHILDDDRHKTSEAVVSALDVFKSLMRYVPVMGASSVRGASYTQISQEDIRKLYDGSDSYESE